MTGPPPAVAAQRRAVAAVLDALPLGAGVLVACSGGADSLALAAATAFVAPRQGRPAGAVVVDHDLLPGSADVARGAAEQCRRLGLSPVEVVRVEVGSRGGPEAAAREARLSALAAAAERHGAAAVLLGHTLDDQAESVLLGLARGSGARSLAGMPAARGPLRRPFLGVRRAGTVAACAALGLEPWHDPTNGPGGGDATGADGLPLRSRVRHEVLPVLEDVLGPGVATALARTAAALREDADALDVIADDALHQLLLVPPADGAGSCPDGAGGPPTGGPVLDAVAAADLPDAVRRRVLRAVLLRAGVPAGSLHRAHVLAVDALLVRWHGQGPVDLPSGRRAARRCGRLTVGTAGPDDRER